MSIKYNEDDKINFLNFFLLQLTKAAKKTKHNKLEFYLSEVDESATFELGKHILEAMKKKSIIKQYLIVNAEKNNNMDKPMNPTDYQKENNPLWQIDYNHDQKNYIYSKINEGEPYFKIVIDKKDIDSSALSKLTKTIKSQTKDMAHTVSYKSGTLRIANIPIDFNGSNSTRQKELLDGLFKQPEEELYFSDYWEEIESGTDYNKEKVKEFGKSCYHTANRINDKIAKQTNIDDLIIKDTKKARINNKYLA